MNPLRGHHLICLHFFRGEGYDDAFVENLRRAIEASKCTGVTIQYGADDICSACPNLAGNRCSYKEDSDEEVRRLDALALRLLNLEHGGVVRWEELEKKLPGVFRDWRRDACASCDWRGVCRSTPLWRRLSRP